MSIYRIMFFKPKSHHFFPSIGAFVCVCAVIACSPAKEEYKLFNDRNLDGWDTYIGPPSDSLPPIGLNQDPTHVFSVVQQDGNPAIRISGEYFGGISTKQEFENYHLTLQFKWGVNKIPSSKTGNATAVYYTMPRVRMVLTLAPGCGLRSSRSRKEIAGTTGA